MEYNMFKKTIKTILLLTIFIYFVMFIETIYAKENKIIRVGYPIVKGFTEKQNDMYTGYIYDYLGEIAIYTGWEYEFVEMDLEASMNALRDGDIDLLAGMLKNEKTIEIYDFPQYDIGYTYTTLSVLSENNYFDQSKAIVLDGIKVGYYETAQTSLNNFMNFCKDNGIKDIHLIPYPYPEGRESLIQNLKDKEIDAIIAGDLSVESREKIIAKFGATPHYLATTKGNTEIIEELDKVLFKIKQRDTDFEKNLYAKYFQHSQYDTLILSKEQQDYIKNMEPLKAVYISNYMPLQYYDKVKQEPRGIFIDAAKLLTEKTCISFEFIPVETYEEAYEMIKSQKADVIIGVEDNYLIADEHNFILTKHYLELEIVKAINKNKKDQEGKEIVAVPIGHGPLYLNGDYEIHYYDTIRDCLNAVNEGLATSVYGNTYAISNHAANGYYSNLTIISNIGRMSASFGLSKSLDENLVEIIHKGVYYLSDKEMIEIINSNTLHIEQPIGLKEFFYDNMELCLSVIGIILGLIGIIIYMVIKLKFDRINQSKRILFEKTQIDPLTGVYNREACERLVTEYLRTKDITSYSAFIIIDIDYFKQINDKFGHKIGDNLLIEFSSVLKEFFSHKDIISRLGGDEFIVFMTDIDEHAIEKINVKLEELCKSMNRKVEYNGCIQEISLSIGVVITQEDTEFNKLYMMADEMLYEVKRNGKNGFKAKNISRIHIN